ncbi:MAG: tRNA uridine-5-carboxymethylaminomethyl(34) synthesis GTPase MnmE, partial [Candidatus Omnitrophota bacterium]
MKNLSSLNDTIVAVSTPVGEGGIGIVRMSGRGSFSIADKIFRSKEGKVPSRLKSYTTHYGHIVDTGENREVIDEVIVTIMRSPRSYTKEDTVEINCHGGMVPLKRILELVLSLGARLAEPGEFTKRAFLNGRIDLAQAESVLDIIKAKTDASLRAAMGQLEGALSKKVKSLRGELVDLASHVEGSIDFPEEDIEILSDCRLKERICDIIYELKELIKTADRGTVLREGVRTVICGRPNVGKSSIMNSFLK